MNKIEKDRYEVARDDLTLDLESIKNIEAGIESLKFIKRYLETKLASSSDCPGVEEKRHFILVIKLLGEELTNAEAVLKDVKSMADADFKIVEQYFEENSIKFEDGENDDNG